MATEEVAATREPGGGPPHGPEGPEERVSLSLLILQRVDHLEQRLERLEDKMDVRFAAVDTRFAATDAKIDELRRELFAKIDGQTAKIDGQTAKMVWLFGLILVAVIAKVFIPHL